MNLYFLRTVFFLLLRPISTDVLFHFYFFLKMMRILVSNQDYGFCFVIGKEIMVLYYCNKDGLFSPLC